MAGALRYGLTQAFVRDFTRLQTLGLVRNATTAAAEAPEAKKSMWDDYGTVYYGTRKWEPMPKDFKEFPERDIVNFPHPETPLYPSKVRMGFVPDSWFTAFYDKTGVSGPYVLGGGLMTFLLSKEWLVMEHEWMHLPPLLFIIFMTHKLAGHSISKSADDLLHKEMDVLEKWRAEAQDNLKHVIAEEAKHQEALKGTAPLLAEVKKENVMLQQEAEYRRRLKTVHDEVKRRLDYMVETENAKRRFEHQHMVQWIVKQVKASMTAEKEKAFLTQCIGDLQGLAKAKAA